MTNLTCYYCNYTSAKKFSHIFLKLFNKIKSFNVVNCNNHKPKQMINTLFFIALGLSMALLFFYWYANYSTKSGFATDENENNIPDSWEKYAIVFKLKNLIILLLGIVIGYLFSFTTF